MTAQAVMAMAAAGAAELEVVNATPAYEAEIRAVLGRMPAFILNAARLGRVEVSREPIKSREIAQYAHEGRVMYLAPNIEMGLLNEALTHEVCHAVDDNFRAPHFFSQSETWTAISAYKYPGGEVEETFAEALAAHLLDPEGHRRTLPDVASYCDFALAYLRSYFR